MNILIIDGQGGKIGGRLTEVIKAEFPSYTITAIGTNSISTSLMLKSGADYAATGENSVLVCAKTADVIIGPVGIVIADSMFGEITAKMASAVGKSNACKILIPMNMCNVSIAGMPKMTASALIESAVEQLRDLSLK